MAAYRKKTIENKDLDESQQEQSNCVFYHLQRKVQTNEFQEDAKIRAVLNYFMGLTKK